MWTPYPKKISEEIEQCWKKDPKGTLMITQDNANSDIQINFELMEEINYQKNSYIFFSSEEPYTPCHVVLARRYRKFFSVST